MVFAALLGTWAVAWGAESGTTSLLRDDILEQYRTDRACQDGRGYVQIQQSLQLELLRAESGRYMQKPEAPELGRVAATDYDRAAQVAAARGCRDIARAWWTAILTYFNGPQYAAARERAEASIAGLDKAPPASRRDRP